MSPIAFKPKSDVLCPAGALKPFERTAKPSDLTYTVFSRCHLEQMVRSKLPSSKLGRKKIMRLRRQVTMSFSLCAVIAEAMQKKTTAHLLRDGLRAIACAMHGLTLGAQVALLQSPIPPAAVPQLPDNLNHHQQFRAGSMLRGELNLLNHFSR